MNSTMARWAMSAAVAAACAAALGGCVVRARAQPVYVRPSRVVVTTQQPVYQAQPVAQPVYQQPVCGQCVQGAGEMCNGCDDNCNGVVDEGCR
jgi:hypothetical protein